MDEAFFAGVRLEQVELSSGVRIDLPIRYQEWSAIMIVAEIIFEDMGLVRRCRLRADGQYILTLDVEKPATRAGAMNFHSYTVKGGQLLRTLIQTRGEFGIARFSGGASFTLGDHPIAGEIRGLGVGKTAVERRYLTNVQSMLHPASERLEL